MAKQTETEAKLFSLWEHLRSLSFIILRDDLVPYLDRVRLTKTQLVITTSKGWTIHFTGCEGETESVLKVRHHSGLGFVMAYERYHPTILSIEYKVASKLQKRLIQLQQELDS